MIVRLRSGFMRVIGGGVLFMAIGLWTSPSYAVGDSRSTEKSLSGKKIVMIIAERRFHDRELLVPKAYWEGQGAAVDIASSTVDPVTGLLGRTVTPDMNYTDVMISDYDALIFVGGSGASQYFHDAKAHQLAIQANDQDKIIGAISIAPVILANTGLLTTKRATVWDAMVPEVSARCNIYTGRTVEADGRIITAKNPESAQRFAQKISHILQTQSDKL